MSRIILVANVASSIYNFRRNLINKLKQEGIDTLILCNPDRTSPLLSQQGYNCQYLKHLNYTNINPIDDIKLIFELYKIYLSIKPAVVLHYHIKPSIYGSIAARLAKIKSIVTITGTGHMFARKDIYSYISKLLYRFGLFFAEVVFFQNKDNRDYFIKYNLIKSDRSILVSGSGINLDHFNPAICNNIDSDNTFNFLLIGRMLWDKGVREFVESARKIKITYPNVNFQLLGGLGKEFDAIPANIIEQWQKAGLIQYLGVVNDVRPFICQSDVVVLPSYHEGIPRSLLEAMAMEKPIITTNSVGCREVIEDEKNGFMVPVKDVGALSEAMRKMIELGEGERKKMGRYGRIKAQNEFDEEHVIAAYLKVIKEYV